MDLVPRNYIDPRPQCRSTSRQLARAHDQELVTRAAIEANERSAAYVAERRISNGYALAAHTVNHAAMLNRHITRDKPGLEAGLRDLEDTVLFAAKSIIYQYMTR